MKSQQKVMAFWILVFLMMAFVAKVVNEGKEGYKKINNSQFRKEVKDGKIKSVTLKGKDTIYGSYVDGYSTPNRFMLTATTGEYTTKFLTENGLDPDFEAEEKQTFLASLLLNWGPMIFLIVIFYFFLRQIQAGGGKAMSFGKSKARMLNANEKKVTFSDVSGVEEAKEELKSWFESIV